MQGRWCWLACVAALASCRSVEWRPSSTSATWRERPLWCADAATFAARDGADAEEAFAAYAELQAAFVAVGEAPPPPPLVLVVGRRDGPLLGDATATIAHFARSHQQAVRDTEMPAIPSFTEPTDVPEAVVAALAAVIAGAVVADDAELALPASWRALAPWVVVIPTESNVVQTADLMIDHGLERADIGWGKRLLLAPFMPWIRGVARDQLRMVVWRQLVDASCAPRVLGREIAPARRQALLTELGVTDEPPPPPPGVLEATARGGQ
jgi:hypothetical protein